MYFTTNYFSKNTSCHSLASLNTEICSLLLRDCPFFRMRLQFVEMFFERHGFNSSHLSPLFNNDFLNNTRFDCIKGVIFSVECRRTHLYLFDFQLKGRYTIAHRVNLLCQDQEDCSAETLSQEMPCKITDGCCQQVLDIANKANHCAERLSLNKLFFGLGAVAYWWALKTGK